MGQYMQKYCGCIFSEEERYLKKYKKKSWFVFQLLFLMSDIFEKQMLIFN
jgi:predicted adenine nucleotide alpha hydrolase (AANH) superfamily ATPase